MKKSPSSSTQSTPPSTQTDTPESPSHINPDPQPLSLKRSHSTTPLHGTRPSALPVAEKSKGGRCAGSPQSKAIPSCARVHLNSYLPSDDYRFTTALCILKQLVQQYHTGMPATPTRTPAPLHTPSPVSQTPHSRPPSSGTRADENETTSRSPS